VIPDAYNDRSYEARLDRFQPMVNRQRGVIEAHVRILNPDQYLLPEMNCRVEILREAQTDQEERLRIPRQAISEDKGETFVYLVENDTARRRVVETGETVGDSVEILKGLEPGDVVLLPGKETISEGQPVRPRVQSQG
jgi:membrane fusion protein (multidrug efflux system)